MQKKCLITGGASGIGKEVLERLVRMEHRVAVIDVAEMQSSSEVVKTIQADLADADQAKAAFSEAAEFLGGIDSAINAAGVFGPMARFDKITEQQLDEVTFANIRMCFHAMQQEIALMLNQGHGRIVNIASVAGQSGIVFKADYCAAKHAIIGMTKAASLEVVKAGISINSVSPGFVDTPMTAKAISENPLLEGFITKQTPLGRSLSAGSVADLVSWLALESPVEITGSDYVMDGCYSAR